MEQSTPRNISAISYRHRIYLRCQLSGEQSPPNGRPNCSTVKPPEVLTNPRQQCRGLFVALCGFGRPNGGFTRSGRYGSDLRFCGVIIGLCANVFRTSDLATVSPDATIWRSNCCRMMPVAATLVPTRNTQGRGMAPRTETMAELPKSGWLGWSNATGTSNRSCPCGSWKDHWLTHSGKSWPSTCSVVDCDNSPELGAHVKNPGVTGHRITPMCVECNQRTDTFSLRGTLTNADTNR